MPRHLSRFLKVIQKSRSPLRRTSRTAELQEVRTALRQCVNDCQGMDVDRLMLRITSARTHHELWMLRSDAYRLISLSHCQSVATERISGLLHHFKGRIASRDIRRSL